MFKLFKNFRKKDWILIVFIVVLVIFQVWLELKMPDYMSEITKLVKTEGSEMKDILRNGGLMLLCAFGSLIGAVLTGYSTANLSANFSKVTREKLFDKVERLSMSEVKEFSTSSLITRTTNDITHIEMLISMGMQLTIKAPITAIWAVIKILNKSWQWSALTGLAVVILLSIIGVIISVVLPRFKIVQKLVDKLNSVTRENLTGIRVVRAFNAEEYQKEKFEDVNTELTNLQMSNQKMFAFMQPVMYLVMYGLTLAIYFVGAYMIKDADFTDKIIIFGDMIVFSSYALQVIMAFLKAIQRATNYIKTANIDNVINALAPSFAGSSKESLKVGIQNYIDNDSWNDTPIMTETSFNSLIAMLKGAGELKTDAVTDYNKIINTNFATLVMNEYFA